MLLRGCLTFAAWDEFEEQLHTLGHYMTAMMDLDCIFKQLKEWNHRTQQLQYISFITHSLNHWYHVLLTFKRETEDYFQPLPSELRRTSPLTPTSPPPMRWRPPAPSLPPAPESRESSTHSSLPARAPIPARRSCSESGLGGCTISDVRAPALR